MTSINIAIINLGRIGYQASLHLQNKVANTLKSKINKWSDGVILLMEYPPLYTVGVRTKNYSVKDEQRLLNTGAEYYKTNRGGLITFHGPGQLVVYPIINLKCWNRLHSIRWYIETLEETIIDLCKAIDVIAHRYNPHPGIWVGEKKLCAVGVHASRHVTTHGLAINCNTDLNWFKHIVPCGIEGKGVTSFSEILKRDISIDNVIPLFIDSFEVNFSCKLHKIDISELDFCTSAN